MSAGAIAYIAELRTRKVTDDIGASQASTPATGSKTFLSGISLQQHLFLKANITHRWAKEKLFKGPIYIFTEQVKMGEFRGERQ